MERRLQRPLPAANVEDVLQLNPKFASSCNNFTIENNISSGFRIFAA